MREPGRCFAQWQREWQPVYSVRGHLCVWPVHAGASYHQGIGPVGAAALERGAGARHGQGHQILHPKVGLYSILGASRQIMIPIYCKWQCCRYINGLGGMQHKAMAPSFVPGAWRRCPTGRAQRSCWRMHSFRRRWTRRRARRSWPLNPRPSKPCRRQPAPPWCCSHRTPPTAPPSPPMTPPGPRARWAALFSRPASKPCAERPR